MSDPLSPAVIAAAKDAMASVKANGLSIITAESCTSGLLASALSEAPGAAEHLHGGIVTYTKHRKSVLLGVPEELLCTKGAVCDEVACAMAEGALERSSAGFRWRSPAWRVPSRRRCRSAWSSSR